MCLEDAAEGRAFKGDIHKKCSAVPRLDGRGDLKIVLECLYKQITEAKTSN